MPTFTIIYCRFGIPLSNLIMLSYMPKAGKDFRNFYIKRRFNSNLIARIKRFRQEYLDYINPLLVRFSFCRYIINLKIQTVNISPVFLFGENKTVILKPFPLFGKSCLGILISIWPEMKPYKFKGIG